MAYTLSRIDRKSRTYELSATVLAQAAEVPPDLTGVDVALLPKRSAPTAATVWYPAEYADGSFTVLLAGPDADSTGALVVPADADLWMRIADSPEVDAEKLERITVLGGGPNLPAASLYVGSVNGKAGTVTLDADDVGAVDAAGRTYTRPGDVTKPATSPNAPLFTRQGPILTTAQAGSASVYWPFLVNMSEAPGAVARWYLYWSLDHSVAGGIYLKTADTLADLFNPAAGTMRGQVYVDTVAGSQTETGTVVIVPDDPNGLPIYLYYQQKGVGTNQSTCLARSADGITFTRYGVVIEKQYASPGDGSHTYAHVHRFGTTFVAHHLNGQGDWAGMGTSWSYDGRKWRVDPRRLSPRPDITGDNAKRLDWHSMCLFQWRGQLWGAFGVSNLVSGGAIANTVQYVAPVAPSLRDLAGRPVLATTGLLSGETSAESFSSIAEEDGVLYAMYRSGTATGSISYATAVA